MTGFLGEAAPRHVCCLRIASASAPRGALFRGALFRSCRGSGAATSIGVLCVTHTLKHTQAHRHTDTQTDKHTHTLSHTHTHKHSHTRARIHTHTHNIEREREREASTSLDILCVQQQLLTVDAAPRRSNMHGTPLLPRRHGTRSAGIHQEAQARYAALAPLPARGTVCRSSMYLWLCDRPQGRYIFGCVIGLCNKQPLVTAST